MAAPGIRNCPHGTTSFTFLRLFNPASYLPSTPTEIEKAANLSHFAAFAQAIKCVGRRELHRTNYNSVGKIREINHPIQTVGLVSAR